MPAAPSMPSLLLPRRLAGPLLAAALAAALSGCSTFGGDSAPSQGGSPSGGSTLSNYFKFGTATTPPVAPPMVAEDFECPAVDILDGAAALRQGGQGAETVRYQLSITNTARECTLQGNDIVIKVGVEGLGLLGPAGAPGTYTAPVRIVAKRGDKVLVSRLVRQPVSVGGATGQGTFVVVENSIVVPKEGAELTLLVGFDANGRAAEPARRKRRAPQG